MVPTSSPAPCLMRANAPIVPSRGVDASRGAQNRECESAAAIRSKNRFWRAAMRRQAPGNENFFIAKNHDSESAQRGFGRTRRVAMTSTARRSLNARNAKTPAAQALLGILTIAGYGFSRTIRIVVRRVCHLVDARAWRALTSVRQHFLKRDAVFSNVLVYSGCSAFRFPSARSDYSHLTTLGGQHGQES
jgi:hypothetical protein